MQKKWKKTGAALLIAGLTVTGASYAWADEKEQNNLDLSQLLDEETATQADELTEETTVDQTVATDEETVVQEDTDQEGTNEESADQEDQGQDEETAESTDTVTVEGEENALPETPEGYTAGNLAALGTAYEKVQNPTAKAAIKRNMERSVEKWESKQSTVDEQPSVKEEPVKQEKQAKPAKVVPVKAPEAQLNAQHKEQRAELKAAQKAEREDLKAELKSEKAPQKQAKNENKN